MKGILRDMIFFRKKKPEAPPPKPAKPEPVKAAPIKPAKKPEPTVALAPETKTHKSLQEIAHTRVLTAEGWRRFMEKKVLKKSR
jgi:hypothetical protein